MSLQRGCNPSAAVLQPLILPATTTLFRAILNPLFNLSARLQREIAA